MQEIKGHKPSQPGLRGHSHDPENDLMKQYVVRKEVKHGWLWVQSFDEMKDAIAFILEQNLEEGNYSVLDQFRDN